MDSDALRRTIARIDERRRARAAALQDRVQQLPDRGIAGAGALRPGDRVFDTVSGQYAEVVYATRQNLVVPTSDE